MVVKFGNYMKFFLILVLLSPIGCVQPSGVSEEVPDAYRLSLQDFEHKKNRLESKINECEKRRIVVDVALLKPLGLTLEEYKKALFVLNDRAEKNCESGLREQFFYAAAIHRQVARAYNLDAGEAAEYSEEIFLLSAKKKMEYEASYARLDEQKRNALESMPELNLPFLLLDTIDKLKTSI